MFMKENIIENNNSEPLSFFVQNFIKQIGLGTKFKVEPLVSRNGAPQIKLSSENGSVIVDQQGGLTKIADGDLKLLFKLLIRV